MMVGAFAYESDCICVSVCVYGHFYKNGIFCFVSNHVLYLFYTVYIVLYLEYLFIPTYLVAHISLLFANNQNNIQKHFVVSGEDTDDSLRKAKWKDAWFLHDMFEFLNQSWNTSTTGPSIMKELNPLSFKPLFKPIYFNWHKP